MRFFFFFFGLRSCSHVSTVGLVQDRTRPVLDRYDGLPTVRACLSFWALVVQSDDSRRIRIGRRRVLRQLLDRIPSVWVDPNLIRSALEGGSKGAHHIS